MDYALWTMHYALWMDCMLPGPTASLCVRLRLTKDVPGAGLHCTALHCTALHCTIGKAQQWAGGSLCDAHWVNDGVQQITLNNEGKG